MSIRGIWDENFDQAAGVFSDLVLSGPLRGGACAVYVDGALVLDVWGGWADEDCTKIWDRDTLAPLAQAGTMLPPLAMLMSCEAQRHQLDDPVSLVWPEFGRHGKSAITHRQVLCHTAGLPSFDVSLGTERLLAADELTETIADSAPEHEPGTATSPRRDVMAHTCGEVLRRLDAKPVRDAIAERIATPLLADVHLGLAQSDLPRCAAPSRGDDGSASLLGTRAARLGTSPTFSSQGSALGLARVYRILVDGGHVGGIDLLSADTVTQALADQSGPDQHGRHHGLGLTHGLAADHQDTPRGSGQRGAGVTIGFADPEAKLTMAMVSPLVSSAPTDAGDDLIRSVYAAL